MGAERTYTPVYDTNGKEYGRLNENKEFEPLSTYNKDGYEPTNLKLAPTSLETKNGTQNVAVDEHDGYAVVKNQEKNFEGSQTNETQREDYEYNQGSFTKYLSDHGLSDVWNQFDPNQREEVLRKYMLEYDKRTPQPPKDEDKIKRLQREKKYSALGSLFGGLVGLTSDVASASQGGIVPERKTAIDTREPDAKIRAEETDYKNRLAQWYKDRNANMQKYSETLENYRKELLKGYNEWLGRKKSTTTTGNKTTEGYKTDSGVNVVKTDKDGGSGSGGKTYWTNLFYTPKNGGEQKNIHINYKENSGLNALRSAINRIGLGDIVLKGYTKPLNEVLAGIATATKDGIDKSDELQSISQIILDGADGERFFNALVETLPIANGSYEIKGADGTPISEGSAPASASANAVVNAGGSVYSPASGVVWNQAGMNVASGNGSGVGSNNGKGGRFYKH